MTNNEAKDEETLNELEWYKLRYAVEDNKQELFMNKLLRKIKENPLVPIGALTTVAALSYGIFAFYQKNSRKSQYMMRLRVGAQAFTIAALTIGYMFTPKKEKQECVATEF